MQTQYNRKQVDNLLLKVFCSEDNEFLEEDKNAFQGLVDLFYRAANNVGSEPMVDNSRNNLLEGTAKGYRFMITQYEIGAELVIWKPNTLREITITYYDDGYRIVHIPSLTEAICSEMELNKAIGYFLNTGKQTPSLIWQEKGE